MRDCTLSLVSPTCFFPQLHSTMYTLKLSCKSGFKWEDTRILKTEKLKFDCKVREASEIQLQDMVPCSEHGLNQDNGQ